MTGQADLDVAQIVAEALTAVGVDYLIGGSVASGLLGEPRATADIDFAVRLGLHQIAPLRERLGPDFEVDEDMLRDAVNRGRSANIYHLPTVTKVDLFVRGREAFDRSEFERRISVQLGAGAPVHVASPEDNLLRKLKWFRNGGEVSELQWRDVLGMLRVGGEKLDWQYLDAWAPRLGVADLLERARSQVEAG